MDQGEVWIAGSEKEGEGKEGVSGSCLLDVWERRWGDVQGEDGVEVLVRPVRGDVAEPVGVILGVPLGEDGFGEDTEKCTR